MFAPLAGTLAVALIFFSTTAFFWLALLCLGWITFTIVGLKRLPKVEFESVSPVPVDLLNRYNHAWVAPAMTRMASVAIGVWQLASIAAVIVFFARSDYFACGLFALAFFALSFAAGLTNPTLHIKKQGLNEEATELMHA